MSQSAQSEPERVEPGRLPARALAAVLAGRSAAWLSRRLGRGRGTTVGGHVARVIDPDLLARLTRGHQVVLVSGTNGKSTTARLTAEALGGAGTVGLNRGGANMTEGIVLAAAAGRRSRRFVFEVDESYLGRIAAQTTPSVLALLNLSRDQLDRVSEVARVAARWRADVAGLPSTTVVLANADDPLVAWAAEPAERTGSVLWLAPGGSAFRGDATLCPRCHALLTLEETGWSCTGCGVRRPEPVLWLDETGARHRDGRHWALPDTLPGRVNRANAMTALAVALVAGVDPDQALRRMSLVEAVDGRYERWALLGRQVRLLLAKNPAGWAELLDMLDPDAAVVVAVNARAADGRDTSWLWDVDFERLAGRAVGVSGDRRADVAVRLEVAEVDVRVCADIAETLAALPAGRVDIAANYTAMQDLRAVLEAGTRLPGRGGEDVG